MRRLHLDLFGVTALAALVLIVTLLGLENAWVRSLLALPLALFGVGYLVGAAIFPLRTLGSAERFLLSVGLSLSILILTGLRMHLGPIGMRPVGWAWLLFVISAAAAFLAFYRRRLAAGSESETLQARPPELAQTARTRSRSATPLIVVMFGVSALMIGLSAALVRMPAPQTSYEGYSMLWMAPIEESSSGEAELGVRSMEFETQTYRLELVAGEQLVEEWDGIQLAPREQWTVRLDMTDFPRGDEPLEARLYRTGQVGSGPYRQARLWPPPASDSVMLEGPGQ